MFGTPAALTTLWMEAALYREGGGRLSLMTSQSCPCLGSFTEENKACMFKLLEPGF